MTANFKEYLMLLQKCFGGSELENYRIQQLFHLKIKKNKDCVLSIKWVVFGVHVTLVKPSLMQKLHEMNVIILLKVQIQRNTFEAT